MMEIMHTSYETGAKKKTTHRQTSNINRALVGNKLVDHSDVVGASHIGAAPTISSFSIKHLTSMDLERQLQYETRINEVLGFGATYIRYPRYIKYVTVSIPFYHVGFLGVRLATLYLKVYI